MVRFVAAPALADRMVFAGIAVLAVLPERTGLENFREADLREVFLPRDIGWPHPPRPSPALLGFAPDLFLCTAITSSVYGRHRHARTAVPYFSQNVSQDQYPAQRYHPLIHAYALTRVRFNHFTESAVGQTKGTILQNLDQPVIIKARDAGVELNLVFP